MKNKHHLELLKEIKAHATKKSIADSKKWSRYVGSSKFSYGLTTPVVRKIVKDWIRAHPDLLFREYLSLLKVLYSCESRTERSIAGYLMEYLPDFRSKIDLRYLDEWLGTAEGWAEVDSICAMSFTAEDMFLKWQEWSDFLITLSGNRNMHKRRASLVFLTKPVRESDDKKLSKLAFQNVEKLKAEKHILITKAVSWLLRELVKNHRAEVKKYLSANKDSLPRIAVRETKTKLETGVKTKRR